MLLVVLLLLLLLLLVLLLLLLLLHLLREEKYGFQKLLVGRAAGAGTSLSCASTRTPFVALYLSRDAGISLSFGSGGCLVAGPIRYEQSSSLAIVSHPLIRHPPLAKDKTKKRSKTWQPVWYLLDLS